MQQITVAAVAMRAVHDKASNLAAMLATIEQCATQGADLVVFPELCLQVYLPSLTNYDLTHVSYQVENAETVAAGPSVQAIAEAAARHEVHVVFGMTERDEDRAEVLYNTAVLVGPDAVVGSYRKVHQPGDEKHIYHPGAGFTVFETPIGRIGMLARSSSRTSAAWSDGKSTSTPTRSRAGTPTPRRRSTSSAPAPGSRSWAITSAASKPGTLS